MMDVMVKTDIMTEGMNCLTEHLGTLKAEMFVAAIIRESFDYTEWQRAYFDAKSPAEISREAKQYEKDHPFQGNAVRLSHRLRPEDPDPAADQF